MSAPPGDPWSTFVAGAEPTRRERLGGRLSRTADVLRVPALVATAVVLLGAPVGLLWAAVSPRVSVSFSAEGPALDRPESSEFFAADGSFGVVLLVVGLLTGVAVRLVRRRRTDRADVPVGIAVGALVAALVAREVGGRVAVDERLAQLCDPSTCTLYDGTLSLRSTGLVVVWAVAALAAYAATSLLVDRPRDDGPL